MVKYMNNYVWFLVASVVIASISQILLKKSARKRHESILQEYLNVNVIIGYGLMVLSTMTTILAYRGLEYKNGPVIESLGYILVMVLSGLFFQERISRRKLLGNLLILLGILIFYI